MRFGSPRPAANHAGTADAEVDGAVHPALGIGVRVVEARQRRLARGQQHAGDERLVLQGRGASLQVPDPDVHARDFEQHHAGARLVQAGDELDQRCA
jgi:hypothetical protein